MQVYNHASGNADDESSNWTGKIVDSKPASFKKNPVHLKSKKDI